VFSTRIDIAMLASAREGVARVFTRWYVALAPATELHGAFGSPRHVQTGRLRSQGIFPNPPLNSIPNMNTIHHTRLLRPWAVLIAFTLGAVPAMAQTDRYWTGGGTWDTTTAAWATSTGGPYDTQWVGGDNAILESTPGTVTLGEAISLGDLDFTTGDGGYLVSGNTLNFTPGSTIRNGDNRYDQTITSAITGSPAVHVKDYNPTTANDQYRGIKFAPDSGTQTLGAVLNPDNTGNKDKAGVTFAGSTTGNTVASVAYVGGDQYGDTNFQSGGWTVLGDLTTGTIKFSGGNHRLNGAVNAVYQGFQFTGGTLGGSGTINEDVSVPATGGLAPGAPTGTLSFVGTLDLSALAGGSGKLEFELDALAAANDRIDVTGAVNIGSGALGFSDFDFTSLGGVEPGTYVLVSSTGGIVGTLDPADRNGTIGGLIGVLQINGNNIEWATDADLDGMPDTFELAHTSPPDATALVPGDDLEHGGTGDGLTNWEEFQQRHRSQRPGHRRRHARRRPRARRSRAAPRRPTRPSSDTDADGLDDGVRNQHRHLGQRILHRHQPDQGRHRRRRALRHRGNQHRRVCRCLGHRHQPLPGRQRLRRRRRLVRDRRHLHRPKQRHRKAEHPLPLPDPDGSTGATDKPVKVYIMSGQSNMVGIGYIDGTEPGSMETITMRDNKFPNMVEGGAYTERNDVLYRGVVTAIGNGPLKVGVQGNRIGPEQGFGHVMGYHHDEPVLLLKSSQGNRGLAWDFMPPGSAQYTVDGTTYAGYGDQDKQWSASDPYDPSSENGWYAGKQYDDCFLDEADWHPNGAAFDSITNVTDVLDDFANQYPQWAAQGFEIAGFVWWQGHWDGGEQGTGPASVYANRYEGNLVNLIDTVRDYYENRYPGKIAQDAPFVVATVGFGGGGWDPGSSGDVIYNAQLAVGDPAQYPAYRRHRGLGRHHRLLAGTRASPRAARASTTTTTPRPTCWSATPLGRAMIELLDDGSPPTPNPSSFVIPPTGIDAATVGMIATTATDLSEPVEYFFENTTNSDNSGWIPSPSWQNTGLAPGSYDYRVKSRDAEGNETLWSPPASGSPSVDNTAPIPATMSFDSPPAALGETSVAMSAVTAYDASGVEYFFDCLTPGGNDSGWQDSPSYTDNGLSPGTEYTYRVQARDKSPAQNANAWSASASATTETPDTTAPDPDPMTFETPPNALGDSSITMTATTATDPSGVEYFFECLTAGGNDSGWQDDPTYTDTGLAPETEYTYRVRARDKSPAQTATAWSAALAATTTSSAPVTLYTSAAGSPFTWDTTSIAWSTTPGGPYNNAIWSSGDSAVFEGTPGTVTTAAAVTLGNLEFTSTGGGYVIEGNSLNFTPGATITQNYNNIDHTIRSAITGGPAVRIVDQGGANNTYQGLIFAPDSGTQALGEILNPDNTGSQDKSGVTLAGSTTGNTVASISYGGGDKYGTVFKQGSATWTTGNITTGTLRVSGGSLIVNGTVTMDYAGLYMTGGTLGGNAVLYKSDRRASYDFVSGSGVAPGDGVGTMSFDWGMNGTPTATQWTTAFRAGSHYDWEVGAGNSTDTVEIVDGRLVIEGFTLRILDVGGSPAPGDHLPVFTYGSLDSKTLSLGAVVLDTSGAPGWDAGGASLVDDGAGTIYLTGLSSGAGTYAGWIGGFGLDPADLDFADDPDRDRLANGLEALFGTNPGHGNGGLFDISRNGATVTFRHPNPEVPLTDVTGTYEWSTDLETWHAADGVEAEGGTTVTTAATPDSPVARVTTVVATIHGPLPPRLLFRVVATPD
jgi:hypothetical protein